MIDFLLVVYIVGAFICGFSILQTIKEKQKQIGDMVEDETGKRPGDREWLIVFVTMTALWPWYLLKALLAEEAGGE